MERAMPDENTASASPTATMAPVLLETMPAAAEMTSRTSRWSTVPTNSPHRSIDRALFETRISSMKQRFNSLDVKIIAKELSKSLCSLRVVNIYDLSSRIFLFKFAKPDHREQLIVESGFRCHLTSFARTTADSPSPFVARLRKFLKTRRATGVSQIGTDRIIEIQFSEGQYKLYLEFYAGGNVVLCNGDLQIIALLRNVDEGAEHEKIKVGAQYDLSTKQNVGGIPPLDSARIKTCLGKVISERQQAEELHAKKLKHKAGDSLRRALATSIHEYPPMLLEHALLLNHFDCTVLPEQVINDEALVERLVASLKEAENVIQRIMSTDLITGFIIAKSKTASSDSNARSLSGENFSNEHLRENVKYNEFHPFKPQQFVEDPSLTILECAGYNKTTDEFFSSIDGQKLESRLEERQVKAQNKLKSAREDQARRLHSLKEAKELHVRKAQAIEANLERVTEAVSEINGLIAQGIDWIEIDRLIELEQKRENPVASIIKLPLKLFENTATLLLAEEEDGLDEGFDDETGSEPSDSDGENKRSMKNDFKVAPKPPDNRLAVDINLSLSGWSNARNYYYRKKTVAAKEENTRQAATKALKNVQNTIQKDLRQELKQEKDVLRPVRKQFWFEKFVYFISSEGYLVLGGHDAQQIEILYRRHLKKGDIWVHADLEKAIPLVIKNNPATQEAPIPPSTLSQAGNLCVSSSTAWDSKAVMSAWWVTSENVSKTHSSGEYLGAGGFAIRGEKNFLPPSQLLLGFAVLFRISDEGKARHIKHRLPNENDHVTSEDFTQLPHPSEEVDPEDGIETTNSSVVDDANIKNADSGYNSSDGDEDVNEDDVEEHPHALQLTQLPHRENPLVNEDRETPSIQPEQASERNNKASERTFADGEVEDDSHAESDAEPNETAGASSPQTAVQAREESLSSKHQLQIRGKRGKRKKAAVKYANQDAQDREDAMRLLGSTAGQVRAAQEAAARKAKEEQEAADKQRRREQHLRKIEKAKALEQARLQDEKSGVMDDADADDDVAKVDLGVLVGTPLPGDDILEAIPVCAPWAALGRYKYKVKLQPGTQKKGKAVREILGKWTADGANKRNVDELAQDVEKVWPQELALIKGWKDPEVIHVLLPSKVRVMTSVSTNASRATRKGHKS